MSPAFLSRMKKFVWKDVPNPNKCSWAKGLDFKKVKMNVKLQRHAFKQCVRRLHDGLQHLALFIRPEGIEIK